MTDRRSDTARARLALVPATAEAARPHRWFCNRCASPAAQPGTPPPFARACPACERGLLVEAAAELAPAPGDPFLLVDAGLSVAALSEAAAPLLGVAAQAAVGRPLGELLAPADAEAAGAGALAAAIAEAAAGAEPRRLTVRPVGVFGVRLSARIGVCGPPRAALFALD